MKGIVYYNTKGRILSIEWGGEPPEDDVIPFMEIDVPVGAVIKEVDLAANPPKLVFTTYPESDYERLTQRMDTQDSNIQANSQQISAANNSITDLELAVVSLYEGVLGNG